MEKLYQEEQSRDRDIQERKVKAFKERKIRQFLKELHYKKFIDGQI